MEYQRGHTAVDAYYDIALDILEGDASSLLALSDKLPNASRRADLRAHHERRLEARAALDAAAADAAARELDRVARLADFLLPPTPTPPRLPRVDSAASFASSSAASDGDDDDDDDVAAFSSLLLDDDDDDCCPICLDARASVACAPCMHALCAGCLELWTSADASFYAVAKRGSDARRTTCPTCRGEITGFAAAPPPPSRKKTERTRGGRDDREGTSNDSSNSKSSSPPGPPPGDGVIRKKASRGSRARRKRRDAGGGGATADGDGVDGPADYRRYGDSWTNADARANARDSSGVSGASASPIVVWFRQDLRVRDNPALHAAARTGRPVVAAYVWCPREEGRWPTGGAARVWLHHALEGLTRTLTRTYGAVLVLRDATRTSSFEELRDVARACGAKDVYANRVYEPWKIARDDTCEKALASECGIRYRSFNAGVLYEPWDARPDATDDACWNSGYGSVRFFLRACAALGEPPPPLPAPASMRARLPVERRPRSVALESLGLAEMPRRRGGGGVIDWAAGIRDAWTFGEDGADASLRAFLAEGLAHFDAKRADAYAEHGGASRADAPKAATDRHRADVRTTARISPYVRHGELSVREVYRAAKAASVGSRKSQARSAGVFLRRLAWRDLAYWSLWRFPHLADEPLRPQYASQWWAVPWDPDPRGRGDSVPRAVSIVRRRWDVFAPCSNDANLRAWQRGITGYPLVDAAMRELWITGYIPNYMRHVVAGFLIEYLNIDWRHGQLWFHDTLVDADVAIQGFMWQNGGHSGMDQWNFVMHPVYAAKSADPDGEYVRRWCPELSKLPRDYAHCPWEAPATTLARAGVALGREYPKRVLVDLEGARLKSLRAVVEVRRAHPEYVLPDGNEALPLPEPGRIARCVTRVDYRRMSDEIVTRQTAAAPWDASRRQRRDPMSRALDDAAALSERQARDRASVLG